MARAYGFVGLYFFNVGFELQSPLSYLGAL